MEKCSDEQGGIMECRNKMKSGTEYGALEELFDKGSLRELYGSPDEKPSLICCFGKVNGRGVYGFAQNRKINGGAMTKINSIRLSKLYSMALKTGCPIVGIYDSNGADLTEGNCLIEAYGKILRDCNKLSGVVPRLSIITGFCFGIDAVIASCSDIVISTEEAKFGIDLAAKQSDAEYNVSSGISHILAQTSNQATREARKIISMLPQNNLSTLNAIKTYEEKEISEIELDKNYLKQPEAIFDYQSIVEIGKEYGRGFTVGFATIKGKTLGFIKVNSGKSLDENSCSKAAELIQLCDAFSVPIITFLDSFEVKSLRGIAKLSGAYTNATCVKISVIMGEIYGSEYISFCGADLQDMILAWPGACISPLKPQSAVELLWKEKLHGNGLDFKEKRQDLVQKYKKSEASAKKTHMDGIVDSIITPKETREVIFENLVMLSNKRETVFPKKHSNIRI